MSSNAHYFFGIPINEEQQQWLNNWQQKLQPFVSYKTWTNPKDLHITLKFLGGCTKEQIVELASDIKYIEHLAFSLSIGDLGFFGKPRHPRVMWTGVEKTGELDQLFHSIEKICFNHGFQKETRVYTPHITLAKKWKNSYLHIDQANVKMELTETLFEKIQVNHFHLYQIHPDQPKKYNPIYTFKLI